MIVKAENPIGAKPGDMVRLESETAPVLQAAAVLYLAPLVLFFLGYYLGSVLGGSGPVAGVLGFVLGVVIIIIYDRKVVAKQNIGYTITAFAGDAILEAMRREDHNHG